MPKKVILPVAVMLILGIGLAAGLILVKQPQEIREQAAVKETLSTGDFKVPYSTMLAKYRNQPKRIQLFGGGLVLSEFSEPNGKIYAGHLGAFWAPPFLSTHSVNAHLPEDPDDWTKGFNHGLVIYNNGFGGGTAEQPTDLTTETADWYPSKMVVSHFYPGGGGGTDVKGVKVALPGTRGFGLKLSLTNKSPAAQSYNVLFLGSLPSFEKKTDWTEGFGWNWWQGTSKTAPTTSTYDSGNQIIVIKDTNQGAYMAVGLSGNLNTWATHNEPYPLYDKFLNQMGGKLDNVNSDTSAVGSAFGFVASLPSLNTNQSHTISLIVGVGSTESEAKNIVLNYKSKDIETEADNFWNNRLNSVFGNLPDLQTSNTNLDKIYKNAVLTYLVNRWDTFNALGEAAGFGQSTSLFPWFLGTSQILAMTDPPFWKTQLSRLLSLDYGNCRAYEVVVGKHLCDTSYAYSPYTLVQAMYDYATLTGDFAFFDTNYTKLRNLIIADDNKADTDGLVNFGNDRNLYEFNIWCDQGGKYTGKVLGPNADRIVVHRQLAEMGQKLGKPASQITYHQNKANEIKSSIQALWKPAQKTFASISYYDADGNLRPTPPGPQAFDFKTILPDLLLQYDDILISDQITALTGDLTASFGGSYGLTSLPIGAPWCVREDWHGPGLYSGAVGAVLTGLFKQGYQDQAYNMLLPQSGQGYTYLKNIPYFSQAFPWNQEKTALAEGYLEGVSLAQAIIKGMFGVETNTDHTKIAPHIPTNLLNSGPASLIGLKAQGHLWDVTVNSASNQSLIFKVNQVSNPGSQVDHFRFGYDMNGTLALTVDNLVPSKNYKVTGSPVTGGSPFTVFATSNSNGRLTSSLSLNGNYVIRGEYGNPPSPSPTPSPTPTPTPCPILAAPTNLGPTSVACGTTSVNFSWSVVAGTTSYPLRINDEADGWDADCNPTNPLDTCIDLVGSGSNNYTRSVVPGHTYGWWVHTRNACGDASPPTSSALTVPVCVLPTPTPPPVRNAACVSNTIPTSMVRGQTYPVSLTMNNNGGVTWTQAGIYKLGSANPQGNGVWGINRNSLEVGSVSPGGNTTFNFPVTAPATAGTYSSQWQMLQELVEWFGAACGPLSVTVSNPPPVRNAACVSNTIPTSMVRGQTYPVSLTMNNNGGVTWTQAENYKLGSANPQGNGVWGINRDDLEVASVSPGGNTTFNFNVTAPATAGTYSSQWQMLQELVAWFGAVCGPSSVTVSNPPPTPTPSPTPTLNVSLSALPNQGSPPLLNVDLTAQVIGTATGPIRYRFDCTNNGTWELDAPNITQTTYTAQNVCSYITAGSYTAKVRVDRQSIFATATTSVSVINPTPPPPSPSPSRSPSPSPSLVASPTPSPSPTFTVNDLKTLLLNFLGSNDANYKPSEGKINLLDAGWVVKWLH